MAKKINFVFRDKKQKKRKGIHSKNKSRTKGGKQWVKPYRGQGR
jgi:hypothetical protein|tara:strand:- start:218 stop:349 length:132 start_codon:yes stop_codon:yes gene_type:complete